MGLLSKILGKKTSESQESYPLLTDEEFRILDHQYNNPNGFEQRRLAREINKISDGKNSLTMDEIKQQSIRNPTHWNYKFVTSTEQMDYHSRANAWGQAGHFYKVVAICEEGIKKYNSPYLRYLHARAVGDIGIAKKDATMIHQAIDLFSSIVNQWDYADAYAERGNFKLFVGDEDSAKGDFNRAHEIEPETYQRTYQ